ncbi:hypothetical protein GCM10010983_03680 [Caulobacter rhizosphaerae]|nr:hypothetical protein GCM10010983_03680 [Caulobacter rhizosphaerae]
MGIDPHEALAGLGIGSDAMRAVWRSRPWIWKRWPRRCRKAATTGCCAGWSRGRRWRSPTAWSSARAYTELLFLRQKICGGEIDLLARRIDAYGRFSERG